MLSGYQVTHETPCGTNKTLIALGHGASVLKQMTLDGFAISPDEATPAENSTKFQIKRNTDMGTGGTTLAARRRNPVRSQSEADALGGTFTVEPAVTDILWSKAIHGKLPFVIQFYPDRCLLPVWGISQGFACVSVASSGTYDVLTTLGWTE
jgi:hypothetical protein